MKKIAILGSTGSIGTQTLDIVREHPNEFQVVGLTARSNIDLLEEQIKEFKPQAAAVMLDEQADMLVEKEHCLIYSGMEGIKKIATLSEADTVVNSLVGSIGVEPTLSAIEAKKNIALANKETLVTAGSVVMDAIKKNDVSLMPIDSEHNAIFQCLNGEKISDVSKITLTASGGPFREKSLEEMGSVSVSDALGHPTWKMGNKITIDSATLMNKGFEVIETHWLYGVDYDNIDIVVHPQSTIHSMVEFKDGATMAKLSLPSMKLPIQYALSHPKRFDLALEKLDLAKMSELTFEKPDFNRFPCLQYAFDAGRVGGTMPAVLNAANEVAVHAFLDEKIPFLQIPKIIKTILDEHSTVKKPKLKQILDADRKARDEAEKLIQE